MENKKKVWNVLYLLWSTSNYTEKDKIAVGMKVYLGEYNLLTEKEPLPMQKRIVTKAQYHDFTHFIILFDNFLNFCFVIM